MDDSFVSLFDEVLVGFLDKFTVVKKIANDFDVGQPWTALFKSTLSSPPTPLLLTRQLVTRRTRA